MAQKFNYYNLVGDNGYGLFTSWDDLQEAALQLEGSLFFRGYLTEREAYNGILKNVMFRWKIRQAGVIDLAALMKKQLVLLDDTDEVAEEQYAPATLGSVYRKRASSGGRAIRRQGRLEDLLAEEDEEQDCSVQHVSKKHEEEEMYQLFKSWYKNHKTEDDGKTEAKE